MWIMDVIEGTLDYTDGIQGHSRTERYKPEKIAEQYRDVFVDDEDQEVQKGETAWVR